jgi:hypothetical protein
MVLDLGRRVWISPAGTTLLEWRRLKHRDRRIPHSRAAATVAVVYNSGSFGSSGVLCHVSCIRKEARIDSCALEGFSFEYAR